MHQHKVRGWQRSNPTVEIASGPPNDAKVVHLQLGLSQVNSINCVDSIVNFNGWSVPLWFLPFLFFSSSILFFFIFYFSFLFLWGGILVVNIYPVLILPNTSTIPTHMALISQRWEKTLKELGNKSKSCVHNPIPRSATACIYLKLKHSMFSLEIFAFDDLWFMLGRLLIPTKKSSVERYFY